MTAIIIKTAQLLLSLCIITTVHELGHFLWARIFGMKVSKLQIFGFSILSWTSKRTGTKYGLGWLPLGGYCLIPDIQNGQKAWKKLLVYAGGVINNMLLACAIFMCIVWISTPTTTAHSPEIIERGAYIMSQSIQGYGQAVASSDMSDTGGLLTLGNIFPSTWQWLRFWFITAYLSMAIAFMNILPIPGLDGGQISFIIIEAIIRRPLNETFKLCANLLGLLFVLGIIIYGNYNDIRYFLI